MSRVSIEVFTDNHHSSSVYEWNDFRGLSFRSLDSVYITVDKAVNIVIETRQIEHLPVFITIWFKRHFIYDDKINKSITGPAPQQTHFSFHNQR